MDLHKSSQYNHNQQDFGLDQK